jgi:hypothetical protein
VPLPNGCVVHRRRKNNTIQVQTNDRFGRTANQLILLQNLLALGSVCQKQVLLESTIPGLHYHSTLTCVDFQYTSSRKQEQRSLCDDSHVLNSTSLSAKYLFYLGSTLHTALRPSAQNFETARSLLMAYLGIEPGSALGRSCNTTSINYTTTALVHIRSGDVFAANPHPKYGQPPLEYYQLALSTLVQRHGITHVLALSQDDASPIYQHLPTIMPVELRRDLDFDQVVHHLLCAHHVVAAQSTLKHILSSSPNWQTFVAPFSNPAPRPHNSNVQPHVVYNYQAPGYSVATQWTGSDAQRLEMIHYRGGRLVPS